MFADISPFLLHYWILTLTTFIPSRWSGFGGSSGFPCSILDIPFYFPIVDYRLVPKELSCWSSFLPSLLDIPCSILDIPFYLPVNDNNPSLRAGVGEAPTLLKLPSPPLYFVTLHDWLKKTQISYSMV